MKLQDGPEQLVRLNHIFEFETPRYHLVAVWIKLESLAKLIFSEEENPTCNTSTKTPGHGSQLNTSEAGASETAIQQPGGE